MNRWEYQSAYAGTTRADLAVALELAETPAEVDQAAHLSLCLFGVKGTLEDFTEHGREWQSLHLTTFDARHRVHGFHGQVNERINAVIDAGVEAARAQKRRDYQARQRALDRQRAPRVEHP